MLCVILFYFILTAIVSLLSATPLNSTSVRVSWTPVNLTVVYLYTVHYTTVGGVSSTVTFPNTVSSGVVSGLQGGQQYQFSVTVTLNISGELFTDPPDYTLPPVSGKKSYIALATYDTKLINHYSTMTMKFDSWHIHIFEPACYILYVSH